VIAALESDLAYLTAARRAASAKTPAKAPAKKVPAKKTTRRA
jgi:hypothetical protein